MKFWRYVRCGGEVGLGDASDRSADADATTALDRAPFLFAQAAPDAGVLTGLERPLEARIDHRATTAHRLGLLNLQ